MCEGRLVRRGFLFCIVLYPPAPYSFNLTLPFVLELNMFLSKHHEPDLSLMVESVSGH